jgi:kynurenine formamidase
MSADAREEPMKHMVRIAFSAALAFGAAAAIAAPAAAQRLVVDLTHPLGTFAMKDGKLGEPDLAKPNKNSFAVPTFGAQVVYETLPDFKTNRGFFGLGRFVMAEHHGTHVDAPIHYNNNDKTLETKNPDRRTLEQLQPKDLFGRVALIDISSRVKAELDKNGGKPGPKNVTDFSNASANVVTEADVAGIEKQIRNGVWIVANGGWSQFYRGSSLQDSPYINGWNFPGFSDKACDKIIAIENAKKVRINGIVMDNIGIDSGENGAGPKGDLVTDSWHCHVRGLQRGWKFVENAANLGQLAEAKPGTCDLFIGAPPIVQGTGAPARIMAVCERAKR